MSQPVTMIVVGDEIAYPRGGASSVYVRRLARAVTLAGGEAVVLCLDYTERTSPPRNTEASGDDRGVPFEYLTGDPVLPKLPWAIVAGRLRAARALRSRLRAWTKDRRAVVVYYGRYPSILLRLHRACAAWSIPLVASVVEWRLAFADQTLAQRLGDQVFHRWLARLDGSIVISRWIEETMRNQFHVTTPILRVPILADVDEWRDVVPHAAPRPYAVLCADFDAYPDDARLAIRALADVPSVDLHLIGKAEDCRDELLALAAQCGSSARVLLDDRFITEAALRARYRGASALLAPLRDDDRSRARFPSKVADYLLAGRPVVSSAVGEVAAYLRDGESAFLCEPESVAALSAAVRRALSHPDREAIAARGREVALASFTLEAQGPRIVAWLDRLVPERA
jgi:glycosyltransferase involved in cell wall biosynthesis